MNTAKRSTIKPWVRILILIVSLITAGTISLIYTNSIIPKNPKEALIFQNTLLLIVFGSAILEYKFTKPADSVINALMGIVTLITVYDMAPKNTWLIVFIYCLFVFTISTLCVAVSSTQLLTGWRKRINDFTYGPSVLLGKARLIFSIIFLFGLVTFYNFQSPRTISLIVFWGLFIAIWPLGLPELLSGFRKHLQAIKPIGRVVRTDWPNLVRVNIAPNEKWQHNKPTVYKQANGIQRLVVPLYFQVQEGHLLGTGLCVDKIDIDLKGLEEGFIYEYSNPEEFSESKIAELVGGTDTSKLVGFTIEESSITDIKFEMRIPVKPATQSG